MPGYCGCLFNIIAVSMQRKELTPSKGGKGVVRERGGGEAGLLREFQALRSQARQLQASNRQLSGEVQRLRQERSAQESKLLQKASYEEEAMSQFQKEKSYQLEMLRLKAEEDLSRLRRDFELRLEELSRQARARQAANREAGEENGLLDGRVGELRRALEGLEGELLRQREGGSALTEQLTREQFANKKLEMLEEELQRQRGDMEGEIHILLDIEAEKSRAIAALEQQLLSSEAGEQALREKLGVLTDNFLSLEQHIGVMKERLGNADCQGEEAERQLQAAEYLVAEKEQVLLEQGERQGRLRLELAAHGERERRRAQEAEQLLGENERAYRELWATRHRLHAVSIAQDIDI